MLRNADGGGVKFSGEKRYEGVRFNVMLYEGVGGGPISRGKKRYVTPEWPLSPYMTQSNIGTV